jgi:hypothetical protein
MHWRGAGCLSSSGRAARHRPAVQGQPVRRGQRRPEWRRRLPAGAAVVLRLSGRAAVNGITITWAHTRER